MKLKQNILHLHNQNGDTIIEVMLSMALLTMILLTAWGLTNRVTALSQASTKRIEMVNKLKEQAEILKGKSSLTENMVGNNATYFVNTTLYDNGAQPPNLAAMCQSDIFPPVSNPISKSFHLDASGGAVTLVDKEESIDATSKVWVETWYHAAGVGTSAYTDFYVRGCWETNGGTQKFDNAQFVVRINS